MGATHFHHAIPSLKRRTWGLHGRIYSGTMLIDTSVVNDEIFMSGFIIVHDKGNRAVVSYYKQTRFTNSHRSLVSKPIRRELSTTSKYSSPRRAAPQSDGEALSVATCQAAGGCRDGMTTTLNEKRKKKSVREVFFSSFSSD